jgi:hypothetical protein
MNPNEIYETSQTKVKSKINQEENEESSNPAESAQSEKSESESEEEEEELPEEVTSESEEEEEKLSEGVRRTRSGRIAKSPSKLNFNQCHLITQGHERTEYSIETGKYHWI